MATEETFDLFMSKQCNQNEDSAVESEIDSDNDQLDGEDPPTTLRMLLENASFKDSEFIDRCQHGGLISQNSACLKCKSPMALVEDTQILDGLQWCCPHCSYHQSVRHGSWFADIEQCRLKDVILILYCWSRNYTEQFCQHELESFESRAIPFVYSKCQQLIKKYFIHEACSIGSEGETVEVDEFRTSSGLHLVGGVERKNTKNVFFRILPENWTRDDLVTAIVDNTITHAVIHFQNKTLLEILDKEGIEYLDQVWKLKVEVTQNLESTLVKSLWAVFEKQFVDKDITESSLQEFLFRRRMDAAKDPFLFLLSKINILYPTS